MILKFCFILFFIFLFSDSQQDEICQSEQCKLLSEDLLKRSMKPSVAPCDDFYEHICGNWPASHPLPEGKSAMNSFSIRNDLIQHEINDAVKATAANPSSTHVAKYAAELYLECNQTEILESRGIQPILDTMNSVLGGWPLLRKANTTIQKNWRQMFVSLYTKAAISPAIRVGVQPQSEKKYLTIAPNGLGLPPVLLDILPPVKLEFYRKYIRDTAILLGAPDDVKLTNEVQRMFELEHQLALGIVKNSQIHSVPRVDSFEGISQTSGNNSHMDWQSFVNSVLTGIGSKLPQFTATEEIQIFDLAILNNVTETLDHSPPEDVQNLFAWLIAMQYGIGTDSKFRKNEAIFRQTMNGVADVYAHWEMCYQVVNTRLPYAMSRIYVDSHSSPEDKKEAEILVKEIKASFRGVLENSTWLDSETRDFAVEKLDATRDNVAYPAWLASNKDLDDDIHGILKKFNVQKGKYFESMLELSVLSLKDNFNKLPFPYNRSLAWPITPATVNAAYLPMENSITIPASVLKPPFFDKNRPLAMNYGAIGSIIGHEYTHGFDNMGKGFDQNGHPKNWWNYETERKFREKSECFVKQYDAIEDPDAKQKINGLMTLPENIADNGGVKESFKAFRVHETKYGKSQTLPGLNFTTDQLFFVSFARLWCNSIKPELLKLQMQGDPHSPNRARVNVVLGNTPQFAQAFNCPANSTMNPDHKCAVW